MPIDPSLLEADLRAVRDRFGPDSVHLGSEYAEVKRLPLSSPGLNRISSGGIPYGRITRLWGLPSTYKTHIGWDVIRAAQQAGLTCAYWNIEQQYDKVHCEEHLGIDTKSLYVGDVTVTEDLVDQMELMVRSIHVHVVDSTSEAVSRDELAGEVGDWNRALDARVWKKAIKRINDRMDSNENIIVLISHAGEDMTTRSEYAKDGGALEYKSSLSMHCRRGPWLFYHPKDGHLEKGDKIKEEVGQSPAGLKEPDGIELTVRTNKSRVCRPFRVMKGRLDLNTFEFDTAFELLDSATFFGADGRPVHRYKVDPIIAKSGSWFTFPDGTRTQGERKARTRIQQDPELVAVIQSAMLGGY